MQGHLPFRSAQEQARRRLIAERLVWRLMVVEVRVTGQSRVQSRPDLDVARVHEFLFERAPKPFDEDVVDRPPPIIHADRDLASVQGRQKLR